jgi:hypothetical protein
MIDLKDGFAFIHDKGMLISYLETLPLEAQLRYLAHTSIDGSRAINYITPHKEQRNYTLLTPYFVLNSYMSSTKVEGFTKQTMKELIPAGFFKETLHQLRARDWKLLGTLTVPNSLPNSTEPHIKHIELITEYEYNYIGNIKEVGELSKKNGIPVWVYNELLWEIFEKTVNIAGSEKEHPQRAVYSVHKKWLPVIQSEAKEIA